MSALYVPDILFTIKQFLPFDDFKFIGLVNKSTNHAFQIVVESTVEAKIQKSCFSIEKILCSWKLQKIDVSNTMICDNFAGNLTHCREFIAHNCYRITDAFIDKLPNCSSLDVSYCTNITGSFILKRNHWRFLKLSGCFFVDQNNLIPLKCDVLDLTETILLQEFCNKYFPMDYDFSSEDDDELPGDPFIDALNQCKEIHLNENEITPYKSVIELFKFLNPSVAIMYDTDVRLDEDEETYPFFSIDKKLPDMTNRINRKIGIVTVRKVSKANPPSLVSICEGTENIEDSIVAIKKYLVDREVYVRNIVTAKKNLEFTYNHKRSILSKYSVTEPFVKLMKCVNDMFSEKNPHEILANTLFFRPHITGQPGNATNGILGPGYIDSMYFSLSTTLLSKDGDDSIYFLSPHEFIIHSDQSENIYSFDWKFKWRYMKGPFHDFDNLLYRLIKIISDEKRVNKYLSAGNCFYKWDEFDRPNCDLLKYMDIRKTLEQEFIQPKLTDEEWTVALKQEKVEPMSRELINLKLQEKQLETNKFEQRSLPPTNIQLLMGDVGRTDQEFTFQKYHAISGGSLHDEPLFGPPEEYETADDDDGLQLTEEAQTDEEYEIMMNDRKMTDDELDRLLSDPEMRRAMLTILDGKN